MSETSLARPGPTVDTRREQILLVHMRKVPIGNDVDASVLARGTPGFSGADLANLVNEAALLTARKRKRVIDMDELEEAVLRVKPGVTVVRGARSAMRWPAMWEQR